MGNRPAVTERVTHLETMLSALGVIELGDLPGHTFRGNQWTGGQGEGEADVNKLTSSPTPSSQALRMKFFPRDSDHSVERARGGTDTVRLDKAYPALRTGARPLSVDAVSSLKAGDHVGVVVNGDAWHADVISAYVPVTDSLPVRYYPDRGAPDNTEAPVIAGLASVPAGEVYDDADIERPPHEPVELPHHGGTPGVGGIQWGTLAAAGNPDSLRQYFNDGADGKIDWGESGSFAACVSLASEHMDEDQAKGFCAERHHDATGHWPGEKKGQDMSDTTTVELNTCEKCGGEVAAGRRTCHNCGGDTTTASAELAERVARIEGALTSVANLTLGARPWST